MSRASLIELRNKIRADKRVMRLMTLFQELPIYQIPIDSHYKEIEQTHKTRNIRFLSQSSPRFIEAVVDASIRDQADRSRLVEISMACYRAEASLNEALEQLRLYLMHRFANDFAGVRTISERSKVMNMALAPFVKFVAQTTQIRTLANMVVEDIDHGAWSLKGHVEAFKLKAGRGEQQL